MCKHADKKLLFLIQYFPDWYKIQQMCDKVAVENNRMLIFTADCYKIQNICNRTVDNYAYALGSVPDW